MSQAMAFSAAQISNMAFAFWGLQNSRSLSLSFFYNPAFSTGKCIMLMFGRRVSCHAARFYTRATRPRSNCKVACWSIHSAFRVCRRLLSNFACRLPSSVEVHVFLAHTLPHNITVLTPSFDKYNRLSSVITGKGEERKERKAEFRYFPAFARNLSIYAVAKTSIRSVAISRTIAFPTVYYVSDS
jgi:hypothetical protein